MSAVRGVHHDHENPIRQILCFVSNGTNAVIRHLEMSEWLRLVLAIAGAVIVTYTTMSSTIAQHTVRLDKLEKDFSVMAEDHRNDMKDIQNMFMDIQVKLAKLQGTRP